MTREEKQKAIDVLKISAPVMAVTQEEFSDYIQTLNKIMNWLEQEPREDATLKDIFCMGCEYKEQEPTAKNDLGVDCISRQAVIDEMEKRHAEGDCITKGFIKNMPSVTPQNPRWIPVSERLPEMAFGCFVTVGEDDRNGELQNVLYPEFVGYDGETWNNADGEPIPFEVIAWMPLPPCYEPQESEDT